MYNPSQARNANGQWSSGIIDSLETQLRAKGNPPDKAHTLAIEIGQTHGFLDAHGNLTAKGRAREALGHKGRVIDRAARQLGRKPEEIGVSKGKPYVK